MTDTDKIRIMTALAVYDDKYGDKDRAVANYRLRDYIYKNNCVTRILVLLGFLAGLVFYFIHMITFGSIASFNFAFIFSVFAVLLFGIMVGYTFLGRHIFRKRYYQARARLSRYYKMLKELYGE